MHLLPPVGQHLVVDVAQIRPADVRPQRPAELRDVALPVPQLGRTPNQPCGGRGEGPRAKAVAKRQTGARMAAGKYEARLLHGLGVSLQPAAAAAAALPPPPRTTTLDLPLAGRLAARPGDVLPVEPCAAARPRQRQVSTERLIFSAAQSPSVPAQRRDGHALRGRAPARTAVVRGRVGAVVVGEDRVHRLRPPAVAERLRRCSRAPAALQQRSAGGGPRAGAPQGAAGKSAAGKSGAGKSGEGRSSPRL